MGLSTFFPIDYEILYPRTFLFMSSTLKNCRVCGNYTSCALMLQVKVSDIYLTAAHAPQNKAKKKDSFVSSNPDQLILKHSE